VLDEATEAFKSAKEKVVSQLEDFAKNSSKPLEEASKQTAQTIEDFNERISRTLGAVGKQIEEASIQVSKGSAALVRSIDAVTSKLDAMKTPDQIIEIKLNPLVQGLSRAVNVFSKNAEAQTSVFDANIRQTQTLSTAITALISEVRTARAAFPTASAVSSPPAPPPAAASSAQQAVLRFPREGFDSNPSQ
jgi:uncharacterized protein (DUF885 family)